MKNIIKTAVITGLLALASLWMGTLCWGALKDLVLQVIGEHPQLGFWATGLQLLLIISAGFSCGVTALAAAVSAEETWGRICDRHESRKAGRT